MQVNEPPKRMDITDHIAEIRIERHKIILQEKLHEGKQGQKHLELNKCKLCAISYYSLMVSILGI